MLAMMDADVGIVLGSSSTVKKVCDLCGISIKQLSDLMTKHGTDDKQSREREWVLYTTDDWQEIEKYVRNLMDPDVKQ